MYPRALRAVFAESGFSSSSAALLAGPVTAVPNTLGKLMLGRLADTKLGTKTSFLFPHFLHLNDRFTKTGPGQTQGTHSKKEHRSCRACSDVHLSVCDAHSVPGRLQPLSGCAQQQQHHQQQRGKKNGTFCPFKYEGDHFTKTGSGQT
jgi:hypothetical protein